jgi:ABC-type transport system involved in multi-copper enzyme maturation permease subunit
MRNIWIICQKELRSYFVSPIAYLLLAMFAIVFGFFFWNGVGDFVYYGMQSQMRGEMMPMNLNEFLVRPLISNVAVIGLFLIPMISMRLFAEEMSTWSKVLSYLSVPSHFETFGKGLLYTKDLVFYVSMIVLGLFLASRSLESLRWRS